jgi:glycosyltransferase involved in cell wall biosynthesis
MSTPIIFSVVIPVYNKQPHIARSIGSVLKQSFTDFELIVVDDGSTDGSLDEIKKFKDKRIKLVCNEKPTGPSAARNAGVRHASGEWVSFLDADDEWASFYLEKVYDGIKKHPEVGLISCGWIINDNNSVAKNDGYYKLYADKGDHIYKIMEYIKGPRPICTSIATIKTELFINSGGFDENYYRGEDQDLWLKLLLEYNTTGLWLSFMGATYHINSINMVTKSYLFIQSPVVARIKIFLKKNSNIDYEISQKLKLYSNKKARALINNIIIVKRCDLKTIKSLFFWEKLSLLYKIYYTLVGVSPWPIQKSLLLS